MFQFCGIQQVSCLVCFSHTFSCYLYLHAMVQHGQNTSVSNIIFTCIVNIFCLSLWLHKACIGVGLFFYLPRNKFLPVMKLFSLSNFGSNIIYIYLLYCVIVYLFSFDDPFLSVEQGKLHDALHKQQIFFAVFSISCTLLR